jgi:PIN domain nuclease of toxin-antitoxin system
LIYLLDTHVLLWWLADDATLSERARRIIAEPGHVILASAASAWEIAIKQSLDKLKAPRNLEEVLHSSHIQPFSITVRHALAAGQLPRHHEEPFHPMLFAPAQCEGPTFLTHDKRLRAYGSFVHLI